MSALPDPNVDPAAYVLAVADLREQFASLAPKGRWWTRYGGEPGYIYSHEATQVIAEIPAEKSDASSQSWSKHIAAEANPEHALAEVALWREIAEQHEEFFRRLRAAGSTQPKRPGVILLRAVEAAKAYAGAP